MSQLIRCINCDEVFFKTPFDQAPEYEKNILNSEEPFRVIQKDDLKDFLKNHQGHRLENLTVFKDSYISEKPYLDPLKISYFKATNGKELFLIKRWRDDIHQPLRYQLIYGDYELKLIRIETQDEAILKQWNFEFKNNPSLLLKGEGFLRIFQKVIKNLHIEQMERLPEESPSPLEVYYRLDEVGLAYLLRNCRNRFKGEDYSAIEAFIYNHKDDGVLLLKATYQIQINEKTKAKKKPIPPILPLEKRKAIPKEKP